MKLLKDAIDQLAHEGQNFACRQIRIFAKPVYCHYCVQRVIRQVDLRHRFRVGNFVDFFARKIFVIMPISVNIARPIKRVF